MPVFERGGGVTLDVTDELGVGLASGVEAKGRFDGVVLEVTVDGFRASDDLDREFFLRIVFGEDAGVGIAVVATDDDDGGDAELFADFGSFVKLPCLFQFGTSRADDVETAGVAVAVDDVGGEFLVFVVHKSAWSAEETIELVGWVQFLEPVEDAGDDVVSTGSLSTGEDDADVDGLVDFGLSFHKVDERQSVGVGEELFDLLLIAHALCRIAFFKCDVGIQGFREFRLIGSSCDGEGAWFVDLKHSELEIIKIV